MTKSRLRSVKERNFERKKQAPRGQAAKRRSRRPPKQPNATKAFHNRLAVIFDFDDTLAPVSTHALLKRYGIDPKTFDRKWIQPLRAEGWDEKLAEFYCLINESKRRPDRPITREFLAEVGRAIEPFEGVPKMFGRVRDCARRQISDIELEFYLLSCGFVDLERAASFASEFKQMWGSEFAFNDRGEIEFPKQILTHPEKVRYILQLSKGLGLEGQNRPLDVYRDVPDEKLYVPLNQVVYVGDGESDLPAFGLLDKYGGKGIGVYKPRQRPKDWPGHKGMREGLQVQNLAPADYREDGELIRSLLLAVESICKEMLLRRLGQGE
ncbi:MAG TPA: HAD family hydrolase [Candidatus Binatia bacterium]|nr:HAD family hydrolase [Candidatus Binatia bacterium]